MSLFSLMGLLSTIALSAPIIMLIATRLAWYKSFPALFFYYAFVLTYLVLLLGYFNVGTAFRYNIGVINNLLDAPLMLLFLLYFSKTPVIKKRMLLSVLAFVVFEIVVVAIYGFNARATTIVLAPGLVVVLAISLLFFVHQVKIAVVYHRAVGKAVMVTSLLFAYVGYCFVYVVFYLIKPVYKDDAHLVYFLVSIFSSLIMSIGIFIERRRVRSLAELQTTRQELKAIYGEQGTKKIASPLEPAIIKYNKKDWR